MPNMAECCFMGLLLRHSSVGIATAGVRFPAGARFLFSTKSTPAPWATSLLSNGYRGRFPRWLCSRGVKLSNHLHLATSSRVMELYFHSPLRLHGVVFNQLSTGTTLLLRVMCLAIVWTGSAGRSAMIFSVLLNRNPAPCPGGPRLGGSGDHSCFTSLFHVTCVVQLMFWCAELLELGAARRNESWYY
jgi:hypothetical protein